MPQSRTAGYLAAAIALLLVCAGFVGLARDPEGAFLPGNADAPWISVDAPTELMAQPAVPRVVGFRTRFRVARVPELAPLRLRARGAIQVELDAQVVFSEETGLPEVARVRDVELAPYLSPGDHVLLVRVRSRLGPALLSARAPALALRTGTDWEATADGVSWKAARLAAARLPPAEVSRAFPHAGRAFAGRLVVFAPLFAVAAAACLGWGIPARSAEDRPRRWRLTPARLRWGLLAAWALLGANNFGKLSPRLGMDVPLHLLYMRHLIEQQSIPLATQGGEMMQSPLYYLLSAPLYALFSAHFEPAMAVRLLRIVPLACGMGLIEVCFRSLRAAFPAREDLQMLGLLVGGLLPTNLVISQAIGNEPMAALTGGAVVAMLLRVIRASQPPSLRDLAWIGLACGLALLSKVSAVLLGPAVLYAVGVGCSRAPDSRRTVGRGLAVVAGVAAVVSGWYFLRNWVLMGAPFLGTWEAGSEAEWWQEPGYRTASQFLRFGEALSHPFYSAVVSVWDGLYASLWLDGFLSGQTIYALRPPWNFSFMLSAAWLAVLPTLFIAIGFARAWTPLSSGVDPGMLHGLRVSAICVATYLVGVVYMNIEVPFYCVAKSSYMAASTPALAVLVAGGADLLTRSRWARASVVGALCCFAASVYLAFFAS